MSDEGLTLPELHHVDWDMDWMLSLEHSLTDYIDVLSEIDPDGDDDVPTLSGLPYCGCSTCFVREVMTLLVPAVVKGVADRKVWQVEE